MFEETLPVGQLPPSASSDPTLRMPGAFFEPPQRDSNQRNFAGGPSARVRAQFHPRTTIVPRVWGDRKIPGGSQHGQEIFRGDPSMVSGEKVSQFRRHVFWYPKKGGQKSYYFHTLF